MFGLFRKRPNFDYINWIRNQPVESTSYLLALIVNELSNRFHESKLYKTKYSFIESDIGMFEILMTMAYMLKNDFPLSKSKKSLDFDYWMNIRSNIFIDSFKNATIDIY